MNFKSVRIFEEEEKYIGKIIEREIDDLSEGEVVIKVNYSSLNYKDALSCKGNKGVTRNFPHTPGIDAAGVVYSSKSDRLKEGEEVFITGFDLGMNTDGGFGEYIRVPESWVIKNNHGLTLKEAMIYGTAGFTAALSVFELVQLVKPEDGPILVTGGSGGVGSHSIKFLVKLGYEVKAVIKTLNKAQFLKDLGVSEVLLSDDYIGGKKRALYREEFAGVIDTVGGEVLSHSIKATKYGGVVTTCGNIGGGDIPDINVYPFILRGVRLIGIDSVQCNLETREKVWKALANEWKGENLENGIEEVSIDEILDCVEKMLDSKLTGRIILKHR